MKDIKGFGIEDNHCEGECRAIAEKVSGERLYSNTYRGRSRKSSALRAISSFRKNGYFPGQAPRKSKRCPRCGQELKK